ncbi:MAG: glycosyltransferase, partial [Pseudomonadota bacterium]
GSTVGTADGLARFSDRVEVVHQPNAGEAATVRRGVEMVDTELLAIVNADDPVLPGWLAASVEALAADETLSATYPDWTVIGPDGDAVREVTVEEFDLTVMLSQHLCIPGPGAVLRKAHIPDASIRNAERGSSADFDLWLRLGLKGKAQRIPQTLACWRSHDEGTSLAGGNARMARDKIGVVEAFFARDDIPQSIRALERQARSAAFFNAGLLGLRNSNVPSARLFAQSLIAKPVWPNDVLPSQRRSLPHMLYASTQPFSGRLHAWLSPLLPNRWRQRAVLAQRFGLDGDG